MYRQLSSSQLHLTVQISESQLRDFQACALIEELGAGEVVGGCIDVYPNPVVKKEIEFEPESYNKLLGTNVSREDMLGYLHNIEIEYDEKTNKLIIPTFRQDLNNSADIAEEVARFFLQLFRREAMQTLKLAEFQLRKELKILQWTACFQADIHRL